MCELEGPRPTLYISLNAKLQSIISLVAEKHQTGQPILLCTQSVKESELYDRLLTQVGIDHKLLNAKNAEEAAMYYHDTIVPGMNAVRSEADTLETLTDKNCWPYPTYSDLLYY